MTYPKRKDDETECCWILRERYEKAVTQSYTHNERADLQAVELSAYNRLIYHKRYHHM